MPNKPTVVVVVAVGLGGVGDATAAAACTSGVCLPSFLLPPPSSLSFCGLRLRAKERGAALTHSFAITSLPEFTFRYRERRGPRSLGSNLTHDRTCGRRGREAVPCFTAPFSRSSVSMPSRRPVSRVFRCAFNVVVKCLGYGRAGEGERGRTDSAVAAGRLGRRGRYW